MSTATLEGPYVWLDLSTHSPHWSNAKALGFAQLKDGRLRYGVESAPMVVAFADSAGLEVDPKLRTRAAKVAATPDVTIARGTINVRHDKSKRLPNLIDTVPIAVHRDSKGVHNYWTAPLSESAKIVQWADENGLVVADSVREDSRTRWFKELAAFNLSSSARADTCPDITGLTSTLDPIQVPPIIAVQRARRLLLADVPGLGKSLEALSAMRVAGSEAQRIVIICPSNLTATWVEEIAAHFEPDTYSPIIAQSREPQQIPMGVDVVVIGWPILDAWADELVAWAPDGLIIDEGHYAKSGTQVTQKRKTTTRDKDSGKLVFGEEKVVLSGSIRATAGAALSDTVRAVDGVILVLTGTPMVNRPLELLALLEMLGIQDQFGGAVSFKNRFCGPKEVRIPIKGGRTTMRVEYKGATNLRELNTRLRSSGHYMRRTKEQWVEAGKLKPKIVDGAYFYDTAARRRPVILRPPVHIRAAYDAAAAEQGKYYRDFADDLIRRSRTPLGQQAIQKKVAAQGTKELAKIGELRKLVAEIKVPAIQQRADRLIAEGEKVVIAAHHKEIVDQYAALYSGLKIQGGMTLAQVEETKRLFNTTPVEEHPVIVLSIEACKAGHTLCLQERNGAGKACRYMLFAEQNWVPGDEEQVQDRIWRFGQPREVFIENYLVASSVDLDIYEIREGKRHRIDVAIDANGGADGGLEERSAAGQLAVNLYARGR